MYAHHENKFRPSANKLDNEVNLVGQIFIQRV